MILVTGATGRVGGPLVEELSSRGGRVRALVRDTHRANALPIGTEVVVGDLDRPETLSAAFDGVSEAFLLLPGIGIDHARHAVDAARSAGVSHLVYLSSYAVLGDPIPAMGRWHHSREEIIRSSGIPSTFVTATGFMSNAFDWLSTLREGGYVLDPMGPGRIAPVDPEDIAAVAAVVLTDSRYREERYTVTGGESFTLSDQVAILADVIGRQIEVRAISTPEEALRSRYPDGAPKALADAVVEGFAQMRADTVGLRTDTVRQLLGREPHTFRNWSEKHAATFAGAMS
jgi:uncharacterized protein YbjT (DUF2867 family)